MDGDADLGAVAGQGLVDRIVDDLVDEMVQSVGTRRPDVHRGAFSDRIETLEDLDGSGVVGAQMNLFLAQIDLWQVGSSGARLATCQHGSASVLNG